MKVSKTGKNNRVYEYADLTNVKIGSITFLYRASDRPTPSRATAMWVGKCECGSIKEYSYVNISHARVKMVQGVKKIFSCGCKRRHEKGESTLKGVYRQYRVHAETRGYEFNIPLDDFRIITKQNCHYCDIPPSNEAIKRRAHGSYVYNGIDRMNNDVGYELYNIVPCCFRCNRAKDVMGKEEFLEWIERVYNNTKTEFDIRKLLKVA